MSIKKISLFSAVLIVASNMIGPGLTLLPSSLALIGSITLFSWLLTIVGALSIGYVFSKLGTIEPEIGGPVAYASKLSPMLGHQSQILYFHANWIGNLAIAIAGATYLTTIFPELHNNLNFSIMVISSIWILTSLNIVCPDWIVKLADIGFILIFIPIIVTSIIGWKYFKTDIFTANFNATSQSNLYAIKSGVILCMWSFIGIESASVNSALIANPKRNIFRATISGVLIASCIYVLSTTVISGMFYNKIIANSGGPFSLAVSYILGGWSKIAVDICMASACFASLGSWMMMVAQIGIRASKEKNMPNIYSRMNKNDIPVYNMLLTSLCMSVLMLILAFANKNLDNLFTSAISIEVLLSMLPYIYSAIYFIKINASNQHRILGNTAAIICILFCGLAISDNTNKVIAAAFGLIVLITVIYLTKKKKKMLLKAE